MAFVVAVANKILDKILKSTDFTDPDAIYVSLHTGDPGDNGANEVTGGSYVRKICAFGSASNKTSDNDSDIIFASMPACTITHIGLWDAESSGGFWWGNAITDVKVVAAGQSFKLPAADIDVTLT